MQINEGKNLMRTGAYPFRLVTNHTKPILIDRLNNRTVKSIGGLTVGEWALSFVQMNGINYSYKGKSAVN